MLVYKSAYTSLIRTTSKGKNCLLYEICDFAFATEIYSYLFFLLFKEILNK